MSDNYHGYEMSYTGYAMRREDKSISSWNAEFRTYAGGLEYLKGKSSQLVAGSHTRAIWIPDVSPLPAGSAIGIRYHDTVVISFLQDGSIVLDSGGWRTVTTKKRINVFLPPPLSIYQHQSEWYISRKYHHWDDADAFTVGFKDGMRLLQVVTDDGDAWVAENALSPTDLAMRKHMRRRIEKYIKGYVSALFSGQIGEPSSEDCWFCVMHDIKTERPLGEAIKSVDHLVSHFDEKYYVPALILNALNVIPHSIADEWNISQAMRGEEGDFMTGMKYATQGARRVLRRYLRAQFEMS